MHLQVYREHYGIFMKGKRVVCLYIALLGMYHIDAAGWKLAVLASHVGPE